MARKVQEDTINIQKLALEIPALVLKLENVCEHTCVELEEESMRIKSSKKKIKC
jgi:hypothetical protein